MDPYTIVVNGVTWPVPAIGGLKIDNKYMLADAQRTQNTMHFEQLGEVWAIDVTYPSLTEAEYRLIYNSLKPFVVTVSFHNPYTGATTTTTFYRGDLALIRQWQHIFEPITISLTGTEIL